jgi:tripartite-type tricarboxylate transporter receptor subunit TctC
MLGRSLLARLSVIWFVPAILIATIVIGTAAAASLYPSRPIDFIVPWGTGGGADLVGRALAKEMEPVLEVSLPVVNVPGGTGQTGLAKLGEGPADGYMIEEATSETLLLPVTAHPLFELARFAPLGIIDQQNPGLLVGAASPFKDWNDLLATARKQSVSVAFDGFGSTGDLLLSYLNRHASTHFNLVPYAQPAERIASVLGGENAVLFTQPGDVHAYIAGGQLRPVLLFADRPDPQFPATPISKTFGYPSLIHFRAVYVKAGTPPEITRILGAALDKAEHSSSYKSTLEEEGALPASVIDATQVGDFITTWQKQAQDIKNAQ